MGSTEWMNVYALLCLLRAKTFQLKAKTIQKEEEVEDKEADTFPLSLSLALNL